jgi:DNA polymerase-3 subunit delta'
VVDIEFSRAVEGRSTVITITIDAIRELEHTVNLNPFEGSRTVIIIDGAGTMTIDASNALLKTLEEPPPGVLFLLLTDDEEVLLPTIRSRCQTLQLLPMSRRQMIDFLTQQRSLSDEDADRLYRLSRGCLGWALAALEDPQILDQRRADLERMRETIGAGLDTRFNYANEVASLFGSNRPAARELLALWLRWWRDLLLIKEGAEEYLHNADLSVELRAHAETLTVPQIAAFIRRLQDTMAALDANASPRLALETLMLHLD